MAPTKEYNVASKDSAIERNKNDHFCNRIGCSGRIKYISNTKVGSSYKIKSSPPSFHSSNKNETTRNKNNLALKKSYPDSKEKSPSKLESVPSESNVSVSLPSTSYQSVIVSSNPRPRKIVNKCGSHNQNTRPASHVPSVPNVRNLKCNSISDIVKPSSSSNSKSLCKNVLKKKVPEGESSLSGQGRKTISALTKGRFMQYREGAAAYSDFSQNICSDMPLASTRLNSSSREDKSATASSVGARRSINVITRTRVQHLRNGRSGSSNNKPAVSISRIADNGAPSINIGEDQSLSHQFSENVSSSGSSSFILSSSGGGGSGNDRVSRTLPFDSGELGFMHLMNRDALQRFNIDGFAEVLFQSDPNLNDQHRDMRLDIDNMTYEELLALEEKMGTVSTAVSEDALSNCVKRCTYQSTLSNLSVTESGEDGDDIKCSICQEEYVIGDEMGKLVECQHEYHHTCINQWLRLKNWCPVCKASVSSSSPS